ncbi:MAG: peptidylprolyl isomerase [Nitriliruptoraceae bacterium]
MSSPRLLAAGLAAAVTLTACASDGGSAAAAAATVDGTSIPRATLEEAVEELTADQDLSGEERESVVGSQQRNLLSLLIQDEVLSGIFEELEVSIDDEDLEVVREDVYTAIGGEEQLEQALNEAGLTETLFEEVFIPQQARMLAVQAELAGDEVLETRTARHILLESEQEADEVVAELDEGADFAELAEERSVDTGSGAQGGDLGAAQRGAYVEPFDDAVWEAELDTVVGPVESEFGFHVLEVTDEDERSVDELEQQELQQLVGEELNTLINEAFSEAEIEVDDSIGAWDPAQRAVVAADDRVGEPDSGSGEPEQEAPDELEDGAEDELEDGAEDELEDEG